MLRPISPITLCVVSLLLLLVVQSPRAALAKDGPTQVSKEDQMVTSDTLRWHVFRGVEQLEHAVVAAELKPMHGDATTTVAPDAGTDTGTDDEAARRHQKTQYVCRSDINGIYVAGHTHVAGGHWQCVLAMHGELHNQSDFDVLLNVDQSAMIAWRPWEIGSPPPQGAVSASSLGHVSVVFEVNRRDVL